MTTRGIYPREASGELALLVLVDLHAGLASAARAPYTTVLRVFFAASDGLRLLFLGRLLLCGLLLDLLLLFLAASIL